jgi:hypothetical protein
MDVADGSRLDSGSDELAARLPSFKLKVPVCGRSPPTVPVTTCAGDRQLGGRSIPANEVSWRSEPQAAVPQFKTVSRPPEQTEAVRRVARPGGKTRHQHLDNELHAEPNVKRRSES